MLSIAAVQPNKRIESSIKLVCPPKAAKRVSGHALGPLTPAPRYASTLSRLLESTGGCLPHGSLYLTGGQALSHLRTRGRLHGY